MNFGIISTASIAHRFVKAVASSSHSQVVAIASRNLENAQDFAKQHNIDKAYGNYDELFNDSNIDIVYICSINSTHYSLTKQALLAKKHVLCEKPFTLTRQEANELFTLAKENQCFLMEGLKSLFLPVTQSIKSIIEDNQLGPLKQIDMTQSMNANFPKDHWFKEPVSGGILTTSGVYTFGYVDYLLNSPQFTGHISSVEDKDHTTIAANIALVSDEILISSRLAMNTLTSNEAIFYFQDGTITVKDYWKARSFRLNNQTYHFDCEFEMIYEIDHIFECIQKGLLVSPIATQQRTLLSIDWIEKHYQELLKNRIQ